MKCTKCDKQVSEDSLFCEHCGKKVEKKVEPKEEILSASAKEYKNKIIDHLEFIGYDVKASDAVGSYNAVHATKPNLWLSFRDELGLSVVTFYKVDSKKIEKNKLLSFQYINQMNNKSNITNFSLNEELNSFVCGAWYPSVYNKKTFGQFIEYMSSDIQRALDIEGVMTTFS